MINKSLLLLFTIFTLFSCGKDATEGNGNSSTENKSTTTTVFEGGWLSSCLVDGSDSMIVEVNVTGSKFTLIKKVLCWNDLWNLKRNFG